MKLLSKKMTTFDDKQLQFTHPNLPLVSDQ